MDTSQSSGAAGSHGQSRSAQRTLDPSSFKTSHSPSPHGPFGGHLHYWHIFATDMYLAENGVTEVSRSPCCVLLALSWNTAGGGDSIYGVVKCLSPYFTQEWAFLTNFFAEYTCHRNKWELEAKNWFIEVKNMPKNAELPGGAVACT